MQTDEKVQIFRGCCIPYIDNILVQNEFGFDCMCLSAYTIVKGDYVMAKYEDFNFDKKPAEEQYGIKDMLSVNEQIIWQGKPKQSAFIMSQICKMLPIALLWLTFDGVFIYLMVSQGAFESAPVGLIIGLCVFFAFHLMPVWIWLSRVLTANRRYKNTEYAFTNTRIIIKSGAVGVDVNNIYYADIQNVHLRVGLTDKWFHVGDIHIQGPGKVEILHDLTDPYKLVTRLQKIVNDIKTDTYYPNNLRPDDNDGFDTNYKG